jgi:predicted nucleic acid-binding protein
MSEGVIVSDTSPLDYLILMGAVDLLPRLASEIVVPSAVARELTHPSTP